MKTNEPVPHQPCRMMFSEKKVVEAQIEERLDSGIVEPSSSEYSSPIVISKKKDGSPRVCIDYRQLNKNIIKDRFLLLLIEDILDGLQEVRIFSTIDLWNGFFHVDVEPDSRKCTAFVTHKRGPKGGGQDPLQTVLLSEKIWLRHQSFNTALTEVLKS